MFMGCNLEEVDLRQTELKSVLINGVRLRKTKLRPINLGFSVADEYLARGGALRHYRATFLLASDAYRDLKINFLELGYYSDASWAYIKEKQMQKMGLRSLWLRSNRRGLISPAKWLRQSRHQKLRSIRWLRLWISSRDTLLGFVLWTRNWLYELTTGYGERPWNTVGMGLLVVLAFAVGYSATAISNVWDAMVYSLATFATFNLADTSSQPHGRGMETASSIEALLGIVVLALVVFTLGNRMSRS